MSQKQDPYKLTAEEERFLNLCIKTEEVCAELYRHFERRSKESPCLASVWRKTACEEENHARMFRRAARLKGVGFSGLAPDYARLETILERVAGYLAQEGPQQFTPRDALCFALQLEQDLSEYHAEKVLQFNDGKLAETFLSLMKSDQEHVETLRKMLRQLGC